MAGAKPVPTRLSVALKQSGLDNSVSTATSRSRQANIDLQPQCSSAGTPSLGGWRNEHKAHSWVGPGHRPDPCPLPAVPAGSPLRMGSHGRAAAPHLPAPRPHPPAADIGLDRVSGAHLQPCLTARPGQRQGQGQADVTAKSTSGYSPLTMRAMRLPAPQEWVHPSVPCPVLKKQVGQLAAADDGHVAGRGWPPAGPELRQCAVASVREPLRHTIGDGFAAHPVQVAVIAVELGRAGDAQAIALAGLHQLVFIVGQPRLVGHRGVFHRHRDRVTLGGMAAQRDAQRLGVERLQAAHRQHLGVGAQALKPPSGSVASTWSMRPPASPKPVTGWLIRNCTPSASQR